MKGFTTIFLAVGLWLCHVQASGQSIDGFGGLRIKYRIQFDSSDASLDSLDNYRLDAVATLMKSRPNALFEVEGHTDSTGTRAFNEKLGLHRAKVVRDALRERGIPEAQMVLRGRGETEPLRKRGRYLARLSRRVEFRQVVRLKVQAKSTNGAPMAAQFVVQFRSAIYGPWNTENAVRSVEYILPVRDQYIVKATASGFLAQFDTIQPNYHEPGSSDLHHTLQLQPVVVKAKINFENIYFVTGRAIIASESETDLQRLYKVLEEDPKTYIEIRGHVNQPERDSLSEEVLEQGKRLSLKRAKAVYNEMVSRGIDPGRMNVRGMGSEEMLISHPTSPSDEQKNQRVEILILELK